MTRPTTEELLAMSDAQFGAFIEHTGIGTLTREIAAVPDEPLQDAEEVPDVANAPVEEPNE